MRTPGSLVVFSLSLAASVAVRASGFEAAAAVTSPAGESPKASLIARAASLTTTARDTWENEALITDASAECSYYSYAPVNDIASTYPTIWATADLSGSGILASDIAIFAAMNASIPDIAPRGTRDGDFDGVDYADSDDDCWWTYEHCTTPKLAGLPDDITRCEEPRSWGLTLDDGPNCSHNAYYDYLKSIDQKATLFYIGSNVMDWPLEAQRGLGDGHEICAHTWNMTSMTNEQAFAELYFSKKAIKDVLGISVRCWRPPYGDVDDRIRFIAQQLDMVTIVWEEDTEDWDYASLGVAAVEANYQNFIDMGANGEFDTSGTIVLTHEIDGETMALSEKFLPSIRSTFTGGVMPVAVCMNNTTPYAEGPAYVYPNYEQWMNGTRTVTLPEPTAATSVEAPLLTAVTTSSAPTTTTTSSSSSILLSSPATVVVSSTSATATGTATGTTSAKSDTAQSGAGRSLDEVKMDSAAVFIHPESLVAPPSPPVRGTVVVTLPRQRTIRALYIVLTAKLVFPGHKDSGLPKAEKVTLELKDDLLPPGEESELVAGEHRILHYLEALVELVPLPGLLAGLASSTIKSPLKRIWIAALPNNPGDAVDPLNLSLEHFSQTLGCVCLMESLLLPSYLPVAPKPSIKQIHYPGVLCMCDYSLDEIAPLLRHVSNGSPAAPIVAEAVRVPVKEARVDSNAGLGPGSAV
ncbi:chitin deacetylase, carbohydrate esterase family 4 protein [Pseudohyphozyma bogoriensis]|nr:chitin deacetylase, carbohydrate esterase family 4 protein [Pseudohyphozyma bogoriensis]